MGLGRRAHLPVLLGVVTESLAGATLGVARSGCRLDGQGGLSEEVAFS